MFALFALLPCVPPVTAFTHVNVVPMDRNAVLADQTVIVQGETIKRIGPAATTHPPKGATKINGHGKYLIPGLVDMHVHLYAPAELDLYLANGVTTVYNLNGRPAHLKWRDRIAKGDLLGPTIVTCGPTFFHCDTASEARTRVTEMARLGYDAVKVYNGVSKEAFPVLIDTARANKMLVVGHIARAPGFDAVMERSMPIAHAEEFLYTFFEGRESDTSLIPEAVKRTIDAKVPVTATLVCYDHIYQQAVNLKGLLKRRETAYLPPWLAETWQPGTNNYEKRFNNPHAQKQLLNGLTMQKELLRQLHKAGGQIVVGTDANCPGVVPGFGVVEEIVNFNKIGSTPYEAIRAATVDPAKVLHRDQEFGTIEVGKRADFVLLNANPLEKVENLNARAGVMARGRWLPDTNLKKMLAGVQRKYAEESTTGLKLLQANVDKALPFFDDNDPFAWLSTSLVASVSQKGGFASYKDLVLRIRRTSPDSALANEEAVNNAGYWWLNSRKDPKRAIEIFLFNTEEFPKSANLWDSLGEGYLAAGDKAKSLESYRRALEIDPTLASSLEAVKKLTGKLP